MIKANFYSKHILKCWNLRSFVLAFEIPKPILSFFSNKFVVLSSSKFPTFKFRLKVSVLEKVWDLGRSLLEVQESKYTRDFMTDLTGMNRKKFIVDCKL